MDKATGQALMKAVLLLDGAIGEIDTAVTEMTDLEEKQVWIRKVGDLLRLQNEEFIQPIVREFPDLNRNSG